MANYTIDSMTYGSNTYTFTIPFGTCADGKTTQTKTVACTNFTALETGARIAVKFTYGNEYTAPTLKVNDFAAKAISWAGGSNNLSSLPANAVLDFVFDGTQWVVIGTVFDDSYSCTSLTTSNIVNDGMTITQTIQAAEGSIDELYAAYAISCDGTISSEDTISAYDFYENGTALSSKYAAKDHTHALNYSYDTSTKILTISN